jgi:hypothetical protein
MRRNSNISATTTLANEAHEKGAEKRRIVVKETNEDIQEQAKALVKKHLPKSVEEEIAAYAIKYNFIYFGLDLDWF